MAEVNDIGIAVTSYPSYETAECTVDLLLSQGLIACGQIDGPIKSKYIWNGELQEAEEFRIVLKFKSSNRTKIQIETIKNHPYETPEWITWNTKSTAEYSKWVNNP